MAPSSQEWEPPTIPERFSRPRSQMMAGAGVRLAMRTTHNKQRHRLLFPSRQRPDCGEAPTPNVAPNRKKPGFRGIWPDFGDDWGQGDDFSIKACPVCARVCSCCEVVPLSPKSRQKPGFLRVLAWGQPKSRPQPPRLESRFSADSGLMSSPRSSPIAIMPGGPRTRCRRSSSAAAANPAVAGCPRSGSGPACRCAQSFRSQGTPSLLRPPAPGPACVSVAIR
jgi:hypothetical protein